MHSQSKLMCEAPETFFFARQPILDRNKKIVAYELLYRADADRNIAEPVPRYATEQVVTNAMNLTGLENLLEKGTKAFINIDRPMLLDGSIEAIPKEYFVFELLETLEYTPQITQRIRQLHEMGYTFALDDIICSSESIAALSSVLPYVQYVKLDLSLQRAEDAAPHVEHFKNMGITVLAEKVETQEEYDAFSRLGCDLFQGYFFARPSLVTGQNINAYLGLLATIINLLNRDEYDEARTALKEDTVLSAQLLRYINASAFGVRSDIKSLDQAVTVLGKRNVKQWLTLISYAVGAQGGVHSPLLRLAQERSHIMRLLGERCCGTKGAEDAAFIGLLSLLDVLLSKPLDALLRDLRIDTKLTDILLGRAQNTLGNIYNMTLSIERFDDNTVHLLLPDLNLSFNEFTALVRQGYEASENFNTMLQRTVVAE
jgi:EAL and modified HD-GYP domain-containing signal transduction protein